MLAKVLMASELKILGEAKLQNRRVELFSSGIRTFEWIGMSESEETAEQSATESFSIALRAIDRTYGIPRDGAAVDDRYILSSLKPTRAEHVVESDEAIWCFGYSLPLDLFHFPQPAPISNDLALDLLLDLALSDRELHGAIVSGSRAFSRYSGS